MARETHYVQSRDGQVTYERAGEGPPVLWGGGTFSGLTIWEEPATREYLDRIAEFADLIAPDPRGAGAADPLPPGTPPTAEDQADDFIAVLDHAGVDRAHLHTFHAGAATGVELAVRYPD